MSRKRWFIWLAVAVVVLGAAVAGTEVVARRRRLAKMQSRWLQSAQFLQPPHFILTLLQEGKIKSDEQHDELWELYYRITAMLTDWRRWYGDHDICIEDPSICARIFESESALVNEVVCGVLADLVPVAHEWDGVGDFPDFYGIAERRMYGDKDDSSTKRRSGNLYRSSR